MERRPWARQRTGSTTSRDSNVTAAAERLGRPISSHRSSAPARTGGTLRGALAGLTRPYGDRRWDLFLRATAAAALAGIPIAIAFPRAIPLVWLAVITPPMNGPLSPVMPTTYEPMLIEAAKYAAPLAVALVALVGVLYMEYVNWHAYAWAIGLQRFAAIRERPWVRRSVRAFSRSPFWTVAVFAFTPMPYWVARCLAILEGFSLRRYYLATAVGRFPRYLLYAVFGSLVPVPTWVLLLVIVIPAVAIIGVRLARGERPVEVDRPATRGDHAGRTSARLAAQPLPAEPLTPQP